MANYSSVSVVSYNLLCMRQNESPEDPKSWPNRKEGIVECIKSLAPDILATQEGTIEQIDFLAKALSDYKWFGIGRDDGKEKGEMMAVFVKKDRFDETVIEHTWLSETPEVPSRSWGAGCNRMVTYVRLIDRPNNKELCIFNTHLDHKSAMARTEGARLIRAKIARLDPDISLIGHSVILCGDFNVRPDEDPYTVLTSGDFLQDAWRTASEKVNGLTITSHEYRSLDHPRIRDKRIDWILTRGPLSVESIETSTFQKDGRYPSDHFPVKATIKYI